METSVSQELNIRSQRLSDTYPKRIEVLKSQSNIGSRIFNQFITITILRLVFYNLQKRPLINFIFPLILNNSYIISWLGFRKTTMVKLLCPWTCDEGHICQFNENHKGKHVCLFGHQEGQKIEKCKHICDCRYCESDCCFPPNHRGIHKCYFRHSFSDIPSSKKQRDLFSSEKSIGDYIDELVYSSTEEMKYSHIPESSEKDKNWIQN